jgi:hypothetical protein
MQNDSSFGGLPPWMSSMIDSQISNDPSLRHKRRSSMELPSNTSFQALDLPSMLRQLKLTEVSALV